MAEHQSLLKRAHETAAELGHDWIGSEHLLVALLGTTPVGKALHACGLSRSSLVTDIAQLPDHYHRRRLPEVASSDVRLLTREATEILARAEGIAAGMGSADVLPEHVLLSIVWHRYSLVAVHLLNQHGATQARLLEELSRLEIKLPDRFPPRWVKWSPPTVVSRHEFEVITTELQRSGRLYRFNVEGDHFVISIQEGLGTVTGRRSRRMR